MLAAGTRFGPYEIVSPLGSGAMGEVYRARDTALHRLVAIKVLPDSVAGDPERVLRLQREARTLAALNDPNIAAIYGLAEADGRHALVLELVDGATLAERIARGPLPIAEAAAIGRQIAKALEAAHQIGIVHRDLKPANVKVREDGTVKVLDFGLSKVLEPGDAEASATATITSPAVLTGAGVLVGSAAYMAPEQAKGLEVDKRADIWAFGCVLYEMVTGRRAFEGGGVTDTLAAVLRSEPDWTALPSDVPAATRTLLTRCLEKDRGDRVQDISTARFILTEQAGLSGAHAMLTPASSPRARAPRRAVWILAAAALGAGAGAAIVGWANQSRGGVPAHAARFEVPSPGGEPLSATTFGSLVALSPDGTEVVYVAAHDGTSRLVRRRLDRLEAEPIAGTEGALDPFLSPDGRDVGFIVAGEMRRVSIDGGKSTTIWRGDPTFEGATWGPDGTIVFSHDSALYRINANGGERTKIASADTTRDEFGLDRPQFLPGSDVFLYTVEVRNARGRIAARSLKGGEATVVLEGGFGAQCGLPGVLVFGQENRVMAVAFDRSTLRTSGTPVTLESGVFSDPSDAVLNAAVAADGTAVFVSGLNSGFSSRLVWRSANGTRLGPVLDTPLDHPRNLRLSPDGSQAAVTIGPAGQADIWVYDVRGSKPPVKLTFSDHNTFPAWSPDGRRIAFMRINGGLPSTFIVPADASSLQPERLGDAGKGGAPMDWHGSTLVLYIGEKMWLVHPPDARAEPWLPSPFAVFGARFSPDGRWMAYTSTQSGAADVWVRSFPGDGAPVRVSLDGGHEPVWSRDGKNLFFTHGQKLLAARMTSAKPEPRFERPRAVFEGGFAYDAGDLVLRFYDVSPDGRFIVVEPQETKPPSVVVALHWDQALKTPAPK